MCLVGARLLRGSVRVAVTLPQPASTAGRLQSRLAAPSPEGCGHAWCRGSAALGQSRQGPLRRAGTGCRSAAPPLLPRRGSCVRRGRQRLTGTPLCRPPAFVIAGARTGKGGVVGIIVSFGDGSAGRPTPFRLGLARSAPPLPAPPATTTRLPTHTSKAALPHAMEKATATIHPVSTAISFMARLWVNRPTLIGVAGIR